MVLIITNKQDAHPTPVIQYLSSLGVPCFRLNTEALLTDYEINSWIGEGGVEFWIKNTITGQELRSSEITAVWERRPMKPELLIRHRNKSYNNYNSGEALEFLSWLLHFISYSCPRIIGHHLYDRSAATKLLELSIAHKFGKSRGVRIPGTCFSNRKEDIVDFSKTYEYVALKSIGDESIIDGEEQYVFYSKKVPSESLSKVPKKTFRQTINYVQEYVPKKYELRVTSVVDKHLACKIDSQSMPEGKGKEDWRQGYDYGLKHEVFELPKNIQDFCTEYLKEMHLNFGCFDFIVTPDDEYVFLECNSNGQWLWVELATGLPISKAIAEYLMNK